MNTVFLVKIKIFVPKPQNDNKGVIIEYTLHP